MDERHRLIYQQLFDAFQTSSERPVEQGGVGIYPISSSLREIINSADADLRETRKRLRSDGKYFLLSNFYSMVFLPLVLGADEELTLPDLLRAMDADIREIVRSAAAEQTEGEVSGHALMESVNRRWRNLKTTHYKFWGD